MIPAKITNLDPVQVTYYRLPKIRRADYIYYKYSITYEEAFNRYKNSKFIADVENLSRMEGCWFLGGKRTSSGTFVSLNLNQSCFIEPTGEGKCRIISL